MTKLFLFIAMFFMATACSNMMGDNEFLVKGLIKNSKGQTIFLSEYTETGTNTIDSVKISEKGEFKLKGKTSYPKFYMLRISPNDYVTLLIDSANVLSLNADADNFAQSVTVEGSNDMKLVKQLNDRLQISHNSLDSLSQIFQGMQGSENEDSLKKAIDIEFGKIMESQRAFSFKFIDENAGSMSSILALSQQMVPQVSIFSLPEDLLYFEKVDNALFKTYPASEDVKKLHEYLLNVKLQIQSSSIQGSFKTGDLVPEITLNNPDGKTISLSSLKGKYVLLDFWAGWCKPCRMENPNLVENYKKYSKKGFEIFQVSLDQDKNLWVQAIAQDQLGAWKHVSDLQYWQSAPAKVYGITSIPANFLLDREGKIIASNLRGPALGEKLSEIFKN